MYFYPLGGCLSCSFRKTGYSQPLITSKSAGPEVDVLSGFHCIYNGLFQRSSDVQNYNTWYASNQNYFIPSVHSNIGKKLISYKGAVMWREINMEYKNWPFHHFEKTMCNHWLSQYWILGFILKSAYQIAKT